MKTFKKILKWWFAIGAFVFVGFIMSSIVDVIDANNAARIAEYGTAIPSEIDSIKTVRQHVIDSTTNAEKLMAEWGTVDPVKVENKRNLKLYGTTNKVKIKKIQVVNQAKTTRKNNIKNQFGYQGKHIELALNVKSWCHDPSSFDHVKTTYNDKGNRLRVYMRYRAKNAFGALIICDDIYDVYIDKYGNATMKIAKILK